MCLKKLLQFRRTGCPPYDDGRDTVLAVAPLIAPLLAALGATGMAFAAACGPVDPASTNGASSVVHSATVSESNALIAEVYVSLASPAGVFVEYDNPLAGRYRTRLAAPATEHAIPIVRLRPQTTYDYTVFTVHGSDESKALRGPKGSFTTGALPEPLASAFTVAAGRSSAPLILTDYKLLENDTTHFVFLDEVGALVWYLRVRHAGAVVRMSGQENFLFGPWHAGLSQFTPLGKVTDLTGEIGRTHHDLIPLDGGRVLLPMTIASGFDDGEERWRMVYDSLVIWQSATGRVEEVWNARKTWDILDPAQHWEPINSAGVQRWTHLNSVSLGEGGNVLLSLRSRSQVVSLTPDYDVEWLLHGPESDYEFPDPTDRFYFQHTASQLANGNILVFDNGWGRPDAEGGEYSRALELRLDDAAGTAVKAWEYRHDPDIYAPIVSSAYRLESGNTLVNFGIRGEEYRHAPLIIVEVDASGNEVFRVETVHLHERPQRYRAQGGIEAIYGETTLRPPTDFVQRPPPVRRHYQRMEQVAVGTFDLYLEDGYLVYAKAPCVVEDTVLPFFLHVRPKKTYLLPEDRREVGFDNLDFKFFQHGLRWEGGCHVEVLLPEYEIDGIATGQIAAEGEAIDRHERPHEPSPSAAWRTEISLAQVP